MCIYRCFGGQVSWDSTTAKGASYSQPDENITHHVIDRPLQSHRFLGRSVILFGTVDIYSVKNVWDEKKFVQISMVTQHFFNVSVFITGTISSLNGCLIV